MPTGINRLVLRGRREWVTSIFAAVGVSLCRNATITGSNEKDQSKLTLLTKECHDYAIAKSQIAEVGGLEESIELFAHSVSTSQCLHMFKRLWIGCEGVLRDKVPTLQESVRRKA